MIWEAAMTRKVSLLSLIAQEDLFIQDSIMCSPSGDETPLHISALLGRVEITKGFLSQNPDLAKSLNSQGSSPLHLASAKGNLEIVKELILVNTYMCFVLDYDGRSPLHLAAIKGRSLVLNELTRVRPEAARLLTGGGDTCLHLCVKYNRFDCLKALIDGLRKDLQLVNWKDQNGDTILHLAVAKKQIEIVRYLLSNTAIDVHARNGKDLTALDVLSLGHDDLRNMDIKQCLHRGKDSHIEQIPSIIPRTDDATTTSFPRTTQNLQKVTTIKQPNKHKQKDWLAKMRSALMIVASLLATVAFQSGLSPPGGVWSSDFVVDSNGNKVDHPYYAGQSVLAIKLPQAYGQFLIFNTLSFLASLSIILLQVSGLPLKRHRWMWTQLVIIWIAITAQSITYIISFVNLSPHRLKGTLSHVTRISALVWLALMGTVFIGNVVRGFSYVLRKHGYLKEKESEATIYEDGEEKDEL